MISELPVYVSITFALTTLATFGIFYQALRASNISRSRLRGAIWILLIWLIIQSCLGMAGFYLQGPEAVPPRFPLAVLPPLLVIIITFATTRGRTFIDSLPLVPLTWLHTVRIPVEIVLYWLFLQGAIPELMTFTGRNFDIIAGLTAPLIVYFGLQQKKLSNRVILLWNVVCLALLLNIVIHAVLSLPSPFQQLAFDQPNQGVLFFPFTWLPSFIVPAVLFSHLVAIRRLMGGEG